jgi:hypothetical protein
VNYEERWKEALYISRKKKAPLCVKWAYYKNMPSLHVSHQTPSSQNKTKQNYKKV